MTRPDSSPRDTIIVAAWFGLVTGLVEGAGLWGLRALGWLTWDMARVSVAVEIIWIAALFDLLIFGAVGLLLALLGRVFPRFARMQWTIGLCTFLAAFDWLAVTLVGRIYQPAIVVLALGVAVVCARWYQAHEAAMLRFWRYNFPWVGAVAVAAIIGIPGSEWVRERIAIANLPATRQELPNILVIVVDTLRADHLSSYGYGRSTTPNLDRLAQQGVLFENASATSSWTLPSHASMLTGRYPFEHGVEWNRALDGRYPTIGEALGGIGYRTGAFSGNYIFFTRDEGFDRGFIRFEDYFHTLTDMVMRTLYGRELQFLFLRRWGSKDYPARKRAADVNRAALRWIVGDRARPFFAFLNYFDTHAPYLPPQPYRGRFSTIANPGGLITGFARKPDPRLTPEQRQSEIDAYDGATAYVDAAIGELLAALAENGLAENTLVVITSDHGEAFGEHGMLGHRNGLYREVIHVPLILWWPKHIPAGIRVRQSVSNVALPATLMDLVTLGAPHPFPGPSLAPLLRGEEAEEDAGAALPLAEIARQPFEPFKKRPVYSGALKALISSRWHYIVHETLGEELYDLQDDPQEQHNLASGPTTQEELARFRGQLSQFALQETRLTH